MKEYEVVIEILNACAGGSRPEQSFEEVELADTDAYVRNKHRKDYDKVKKEVLDNGDIRYILENDSMTYRYTFTEV